MKKIVLFMVALSFACTLKADEGMWIPLFLKYNEAEMQELGFKLTAEDIYSVNNTSMKDAIVLFGSGCTGELISEEGLLLTNHHCGYSMIQSLSTLENNYLHNGFWAKNKSEEIRCPGLTATFLVRMEDVTKDVLTGTSEDQCEIDREKMIKDNINKITTEAVKGTHYNAIIKPFFYGNQYFMFVNEVFKDIRMVGAPPENIGKFGGDTDNWMWPRHTGDFALFRIYAGKDGKPADYSAENVPFTPKQYFKISQKGIAENDFTLVFGYPGYTQQFLISDAVNLIVNVQNPVAIHQRTSRLDIMKKHMDKSTEIRLMYSGKANSISNGWKKWIGENKGLTECGVIEKKQKEEQDFTTWVSSDPARIKSYGTILDDMKNYYKVYAQYLAKNIYLSETFPAIELVKFAHTSFAPLFELYKNSATPEEIEAAKDKLISNSKSFYSTYNKDIDSEIFVSLLHYYFSTIDPGYLPSELLRYMNISESSLQEIADNIYNTSFFSDHESLSKFVQNASKKDIQKLEKSSFFRLIMPAFSQYNSNREGFTEATARLQTFYRTYVKALMEKDTEKRFYPDANLTMRVTYGQVKGFQPSDGVEYLCYTTIDGMIQKENPDIYDYKVDPKLKALYEAKDFGSYTDQSGTVPVAFIASNHTTGGNSGSPVLNGNGELIGVNFDRVWEGTMSDVNYDVSRCRNISLDIRYFLFIVDKFANAQNIMNELNIVR